MLGMAQKTAGIREEKCIIGKERSESTDSHNTKRNQTTTETYQRIKKINCTRIRTFILQTVVTTLFFIPVIPENISR